MYDQKENMYRHNNYQTNSKDTSNLSLKCLQHLSVPLEVKEPLARWEKQNFMEIFKKQSVISRLTQGEGFDERSLGNDNSDDDIEEGYVKFVKLPSIEYIVQDYQKKTVHNALFRHKNMKLSDLCYQNSPFTSREEITQNKIDLSKHQKNKIIGHQRDQDKLTQLVYNIDKIKFQSQKQFSFYSHSKQKIEELKMNRYSEQFQKIAHLQQENNKLQKLYQILCLSDFLNEIKIKLQGSDFAILKEMIQKMETFQ